MCYDWSWIKCFVGLGGRSRTETMRIYLPFILTHPRDVNKFSSRYFFNQSATVVINNKEPCLVEYSGKQIRPTPLQPQISWRAWSGGHALRHSLSSIRTLTRGYSEITSGLSVTAGTLFSYWWHNLLSFKIPVADRVCSRWVSVGGLWQSAVSRN